MKTLMTAADAAHLIEALYLAHCKARFHQGMQDST